MKREATNADCDTIDHASCRITDRSIVNETELADVMVEAVYPEFYKLGINSDKPGDVLESEFLKEDWMTVELVEELYHFVPPLFNDNDSKENIERVLGITFQKYYRHLFSL